MSLILPPQRTLIIPHFPLGWESTVRVNWRNPIAAGLAYLHIGGESTPLFCNRGVNGTLVHGANTFNGFTPAGPGINGIGGSQTGYSSILTSGNAPPNLVQGSVAAFVTAGFSPTDGLGHYAMAWGKDASPNAAFDMIKFTDNNLYVGFFNGTDVRATGSASGKWQPGESFVWGGAYDSGGTKLWIKGQNPYSNATNPATVASTWGGVCCLGAATTNSTMPWCQIPYKDGIHWMAFWDRVLKPDEWMSLNLDPWQLFLFPEDDMLWMGVGVAGGGGGGGGAAASGNFFRSYPVPGNRALPGVGNRNVPHF